MIMLVEGSGLNRPCSVFADALTVLGREKGLEIRAMHEDIFDAMHHI